MTNPDTFAGCPRIAASMVFLVAAAFAHGAESVRVHFETSCALAVAGQFDHGITLLHSFEYPGTTRVFAAIIEREPDCAMAYWGAAMSIWHPLWAPPSADDLQRGKDLLAMTGRLPATPRERAYIDALATFFSSTDTRTHGERARLSGHYDEGLHSMDYLMYAMLQTARDDEAKALLDTLAAIDRTDTENFKVAYTYASSPARYALERRQWAEAAELEFVRDDFDWDEFGFAQSIHYFARGIGAARSDRIDQARQELATIRKLQDAIPESTLPYWREEVQVHVDAITAWIKLGEGDTDGALEHALAAAEREDAVDKHPVTPGEVLPAHELYADMLLEANKYPEALAQYRSVLESSPNRLNALLGAAMAAHATGDLELEGRYRAVAIAQTANGNGGRRSQI